VAVRAEAGSSRHGRVSPGDIGQCQNLIGQCGVDSGAGHAVVGAHRGHHEPRNPMLVANPDHGAHQPLTDSPEYRKAVRSYPLACKLFGGNTFGRLLDDVELIIVRSGQVPRVDGDTSPLPRILNHPAPVCDACSQESHHERR
jgi:hypothetical protein